MRGNRVEVPIAKNDNNTTPIKRWTDVAEAQSVTSKTSSSSYRSEVFSSVKYLEGDGL